MLWLPKSSIASLMVRGLIAIMDAPFSDSAQIDRDILLKSFSASDNALIRPRAMTPRNCMWSALVRGATGAVARAAVPQMVRLTPPRMMRVTSQAGTHDL